MSKLSNNPKINRIKNTSLVYHTIGLPRELKTGEHSRVLPRKPKELSLTKRIQEITSRNHKFWELINWVYKQKLPTTEVIQFNNWPYIKFDDLWQALHQTFNSAHN